MNDQYCLSQAIIWAENNGYHIDFIDGVDSGIYEDVKCIEIDSSKPICEQCVVLLHECGHILIFKNGNSIPLNKAHHSNPNKEGKEYRVLRLIEEVEAWKRAKRLKKRLHLNVSNELFDNMMIDALSLYMQWAVVK